MLMCAKIDITKKVFELIRDLLRIGFVGTITLYLDGTTIRSVEKHEKLKL